MAASASRSAGDLLRQVPDAALRAKLRPPYPLGCKRIIYSNDFYPTLTQPHVELVTDAIERVTAEPRLHTRDLGGTSGTKGFTEAIVAKL